jgi:hypothetical protein
MNLLDIIQQTGELTSNLQLWGAGCFGVLIGWYVYYINRYRKSDVQFSDLVTLIGVIGGGAIMALFPSRTDLFGAYGIGLAVGFFSYFLVLIVLVWISKNFNVDWFLDGRRRLPDGTVFVPQVGTAAAGGSAMVVKKPTSGGLG